MNVTDEMDEMMDAAYETAGISRTGYAPWKDHLRAAIAAALAAAPTVDYVWCEYQMQPHQHGLIGCPGPDRILLLGPEVESTRKDQQ